jgi:DnaK suppressor protein
MNDFRTQLTPEQVALLRADLERALAKLERSMKTTRKAARPVKLDQTSVGRLSRMDAMQNQSLTQGLQEREFAKVALLTEALERLEKGTYGICTGCAEPIQFERLMLFPETRTCSRCAS